MTSQFMRFATGWLLIVGLLVSSSSSMVLCIGDDGHLDVAPAHHGNSEHAHDAAGHYLDANAQSDTNCDSCDLGGCVDVPLGSDRLSHVTKTLIQDRLQRSNANPLCAVGYKPLAQTDVHGCQRPVYGATHILAQSLLEKRTIVLLI